MTTGALIVIPDDTGRQLLAVQTDTGPRRLHAVVNDDGTVQVYLDGYAPTDAVQTSLNTVSE